MNNLMYLTQTVNIDFSKMMQWIPTFIDGTIVTIALSIVSVLIGCFLGLSATLLKQSKIKILNILANIYTQVVRGTPLLIQLFLWLYGFPMIGINIPEIPLLGNTYGSREFITAAIALGINSGAYICELLRGGLESVDKGQLEASRSLGMTYFQAMQYIIIPQAIKVILPGLCNEFIQMIKESSIVSVVGVFDIMYTSNIVKASTYSVFEPLVIISIIYFILTFTLTMGMQKIEKGLAYNA